MILRTPYCFLLVGLAGCAKSSSPDPLKESTIQADPVVQEESRSDADAPPQEEPDAGDDVALRRTYLPSDLKFHECARLEEDGSVVGRHCPSAFVVFGPYADVPAHSDVRITYQVTANTKLGVSNDVVSNVGSQFHGAVDEQTLSPGETRILGYRMRLFQRVSALEARIGIRSNEPASFKIENLSISVH